MWTCVPKACCALVAAQINMSYGEPATRPDVGRVVEVASEAVNKAGIIFVASAGNAGQFTLWFQLFLICRLFSRLFAVCSCRRALFPCAFDGARSTCRMGRPLPALMLGAWLRLPQRP